jgi:hypothetical protein
MPSPPLTGAGCDHRDRHRAGGAGPGAVADPDTPETLAAYLGASASRNYSWNSYGYGTALMKLGNLVRYTFENVELWLAP